MKRVNGKGTKEEKEEGEIIYGNLKLRKEKKKNGEGERKRKKVGSQAISISQIFFFNFY